MRVTPNEAALLRVGIANHKTLRLYEEAIQWHVTTSKSISDLIQQVCVDRLRLADALVITGDKLLRSRPVQLRSAISRYYYAMYHSVRAVVYFAHKGDDHQAHSTLPTKLPMDFPSHSIWQNDLKDARSYRNDADYDPYPASDQAWRPVAVDLSRKAPQLASLARGYLRQKGVAGA